MIHSILHHKIFSTFNLHGKINPWYCIVFDIHILESIVLAIFQKNIYFWPKFHWHFLGTYNCIRFKEQNKLKKRMYDLLECTKPLILIAREFKKYLLTIAFQIFELMINQGYHMILIITLFSTIICIVSVYIVWTAIIRIGGRIWWR